MSKTELNHIIRAYARALQKNRYPFSAIYVFGSHAKKKAGKWSDIDIAVITNALKRNYEKNRLRLWDARMGIDTRIEPHGFTPEDFADDANPLAYEIRRTGIRVV